MEKKEKREEIKRKKEKLLITWLDKKRREIFALCCSVSWLSWMKAGEAGQFKVLTAQHWMNEGAQFSENAYSYYLRNMI